jgi:VWFA-related protein
MLKKLSFRSVASLYCMSLLIGAAQNRDGDYLAIRTVLVSVSDDGGAAVSGLGIDDFKIVERGVERDIENVESSEKQTEIILAVDTSVASWGKIQILRKAAETFVRAVTPHNQVSLYAFGGRASRLVEPTDDAGTLIQAIKRFYAQESEAAYVLDAVVVTARELEETEQEEGSPVRVVIVTGDGPELSHNHYDQAKKVGKSSGAVYHIIQFDSARESDDFLHQAEVEGALTYLADETGGTFQRVLAATAIETQLGRIAGELRPRYRLSFLTELSPQSKLEDISVSIANRKVHAELIRLLPEERKVPISK